MINYFSGKKDFKKLLLGISRPNSKEPEIVSKYVLSGFKRKDRDELRIKTFPAGVELVDNFLNSDVNE